MIYTIRKQDGVDYPSLELYIQWIILPFGEYMLYSIWLYYTSAR